jgi:hypothetical protein
VLREDIFVFTKLDCGKQKRVETGLTPPNVIYELSSVFVSWWLYECIVTSIKVILSIKVIERNQIENIGGGVILIKWSEANTNFISYFRSISFKKT